MNLELTATQLSALPQFSLLSREQCQLLHLRSLELLRKVGVRYYHPEALNLLRKAGALITDENLVRLQPELVEWALAQAPNRIPLCKRGSREVIVPLEGRVVSFGTGSDCLTYVDPRTGARRPWVTADIVGSVRVVDALPEIQFCMSMGLPTDIGSQKPYQIQFALMLENTVKPIVFVCDDLRDCEAIVAMASEAGGGLAELQMNPSLLLYSEPSSPLRHSATAVEKLLYMAENRLPVVHSPAPVQGGTAPITLAGALTQANAEILSGLVIHQLKRAGAPIVYGAGMHHLDMKTSISLYTCPEFVLARVAVAEMGRFYNMPTWGYAGDANSCVVDEQASAEATFSILAALLAGNNLTHDVGYLESGKTTSPEMIVLCNEIISMLRKFMAGLSLDEENFAMQAIEQTGPDGNYIINDHTLRNFRGLWRPQIFSRLGGEAWEKKGGQKASVVLRDKTIALMESHRPEPLPDQVKQSVARIVAQGGDFRLK